MSLLGFNIASIVFTLVLVAFMAVVAIGIGLLVYAAREKEKRDAATDAD